MMIKIIKMNFCKDGFVCYVERFKNEPLEHFMDRGYFVVGQKPKNQKEYDDVIMKSRLYINIKNKGCGYDKKIMDKIKQMEENVWTI